MTARVDVRFQIKGLDVLLGQMTAMQGRGFQKGATRSMKKVMTKIVLPALRAAAPTGPHHDSKARAAANEKAGKKPPKPGRQGPIKKHITVRTVRRRTGEFVALSAGPRTWYAHFGIGGTKDHYIRAGLKRGMRDSSGRYRFDAANQSSRVARRANSERHSLVVNGRFYSSVHVRGNRPNPWVTRAAARKAQQALAMLANDTLPRKDGHGLQGGS